MARGDNRALRHIYFDAGGGELTLAYDAAGGCAAAATVPLAAAAVVLVPWAKVPAAGAPTAPGSWAEIVINISDGFFGRRCGPRGADIVLSATADTIVHGFEIYRTSTSSPPEPLPPMPTKSLVGTIVAAVVVPIGLSSLLVAGYYYYRPRQGDAKVAPLPAESR